MIRNPILPGFNPDPSICRVGEDYYIATSTFEWYPGVQIHHSRDLVNWTLVSRPLNRADQLDMRGNPDSGGIWAPCLSHADGVFWLVYTDVKRLGGSFKDAHNYIVTCPDIDGEWSTREYINSSGFDPSLFHDDDGRKYWVNPQWNHRGPGTGQNATHSAFDGTLLQEYKPGQGLIGPITSIYPGTSRGLTEAPHLFKRNGYYYLTTAEGGTGYQHAVSLARSRSILGPYEDHPDLHVICAADTDHPIQRTGHGQYVEAADGRHWHTFLIGRPIPDDQGRGRFCPLGRETGIEEVVWKDDWLYLKNGGFLPRSEIDYGPEIKGLSDSVHVPFPAAMPPEFQWLRSPEPDRLFQLNQGVLTLTGRESLGSLFETALVARRQEDFKYSATTSVAFVPDTYQQGAGLTTYYNTSKFHALVLSYDSSLGRCLSIMSMLGVPNAQLSFIDGALTAIPDGDVELRVDVDHATQQFYWKSADTDWQAIGPAMPAYLISDEGGVGEHSSFTGAFVGMFAYDVSGRAKQAYFNGFSYIRNG